MSLNLINHVSRLARTGIPALDGMKYNQQITTRDQLRSVQSYRWYIDNIMKSVCEFVIFNLIIVELIIYTIGCPHLSEDAKSAYKSGEMLDLSPIITLDNIKRKLKESGVFDSKDATMDDRERKELGKLFDAVKMMTTSRARQPSSVHNVFSSLRLVERAVKKLLKEGQISESLASKFHWDKLSTRHRREKPAYTFDPITHMRLFNTKA